MSMKVALEKSNTRNCLRFSYFYSEVQHHSRKNAVAMTNKLYDAMMEAWESLPDVEAVPRNILHVAKHVTWNYLEREGEVVVELMLEFDKFMEAERKLNKKARVLYDDILNVWNDRPTEVRGGKNNS